jgi:hypothetical protein
MEMEMSGMLSESLYLGGYASFAIGGTDARDFRQDELELSPGSVLQLSTGGLFGAVHPVGGWLLRAEGRVGLRATGVSLESRIEDCQKFSMAWDHALMIEPRVGVAKWLSPWVSVGVMVGSDLMQERDVTTIISFTGHSTPFDERGVIGL